LPSTSIKTQFANFIISADDVFLVNLRFRAGADRDGVERCVVRIADVFAAVERLSEKEMQDLFRRESAYPIQNVESPYGTDSLIPIIRRNLTPPFDG